MMSARLFTMKTKSIFSILTATALVGIGSSNAFGQVATEPVGFVSQTVEASSDAVIAAPLYRAPAFKGKISSIAGSVITVVGSPGWTASQFVQNSPTQNDTFAAIIATGTKEGLVATITANGGATVTVQTAAGDDLTGIKTEIADGSGLGDEIDILPYWTPSSFLGDSVVAGTNLLLFPSNVPGVNLSAGTILVYTGSAWLNTGNFSDASHLPLGFGQALIFRNNSAGAVDVTSVGSVPMTSHRIILRTLAGGTPQDNWVGYTSPVPETIGSTGLGIAAGDNLLVFDNSATGQNKSASQILVYTGSAWLDTGNFSNVTDTFMIQPGFGYVLRKAQTTNPEDVVWQDLQSYLQ